MEKRSCREVVAGAKFGMLTVIERLPKDDQNRYKVRCLCDCGNITNPHVSNVANGTTVSCGCGPRGNRNTTVVAGAKFGMLTVIERLPKEKKKTRTLYRCICVCDCGAETLMNVSDVASGRAKSCGCGQFVGVRAYSRSKVFSSPGTGQVVPGAKFGRLTVIERVMKNGLYTESVRCRCDCGNETMSGVDSLPRGTAQSCGCLQSERLTERNRNSGKFDGFSRKFPNTFAAWTSVVNRCTRPSSAGFSKYGAKGICMCQGLREDPRNLRKLIGKKPGKGYSVDRFPDHTGHYSCGQCKDCRTNGWAKNIRWATSLQQGRNKKNNVWLEAFGKKLTKSQWVEMSGLSWSTVHNRLRRGWSVEDAVSTPDRHGNCYKPDSVSGE